MPACRTLYPHFQRRPARVLTSRSSARTLSPAAHYFSKLFSEPFSREAVQVKVDRIIEVGDHVKEILNKETKSKFISIFCFSVCIREQEEVVKRQRGSQYYEDHRHYDGGEGYGVRGSFSAGLLGVSDGHLNTGILHRSPQLQHQDAVAKEQAGEGQNGEEKHVYLYPDIEYEPFIAL